ncbi:MAG TPA: Tol-Pal system beta propeller repeat protein TolB [Acidobacteriaceae bacterium]|jgi:TolB protein|nr:Tol-Pal system beta propeller repeat protein TolB [Acidobacteriaceae bacterium]
MVASAQDWVHTGTNLGAAKIRLAAADFKPVGTDPALANDKQTFDTVLYSDLTNAGIFDMVSKSMAPPVMPGSPQEINLSQWNTPPANAAMVAFGALAVQNGRVIVYGWLYDTKNQQAPQVLGQQYNEADGPDTARHIAHEFADAIITRLGGIAGIAETKIYFVSNRTGNKEIWMMDYDGANQKQITHLGSISLSPRISPDGSRLAFSEMGRRGWAIRMYSMDLHRMTSFPGGSGSDLSPAWSPSGNALAFSSSRSGDPEIWTCSASGFNLHRITSYRGPDVSPVWNPKTGTQIAWISGRTGLPQVYIMDSDGTNVQRMTDGGYATSPSWSPSGQYLAFAWARHYGPGAPGGQDIYVMDIASHRWIQLTHDIGRNDFPSWSPDSRHIVFQNFQHGRREIWTMLSDGTGQHALTTAGGNSMPNWSWK